MGTTDDPGSHYPRTHRAERERETARENRKRVRSESGTAEVRRERRNGENSATRNERVRQVWKPLSLSCLAVGLSFLVLLIATRPTQRERENTTTRRGWRLYAWWAGGGDCKSSCNSLLAFFS